jgi:[ribosomal protein S5]-alanine N-acetyltransferase
MTQLPSQDELPSLTTERLLLRPMRVGDAADVFSYARDPAVLRFTTGIPPRHVDETRRFLEDSLTLPSNRMWALELVGNPTVVGAIEFGLQSPESGSIHYALAKPHWGRGLMTEAVDAVCGWAFDTLAALVEIRTSVVDSNVASLRVLEKCGFVRTELVQENWAKQVEPITLIVVRRGRDRRH